MMAERDEILEAVVRDELRDLGVDEDFAGESLATMRGQGMSGDPGYPYAVPKPGEPQCQADGVRNGPDGPGGTEHYWTCTAPGTVDVDGELLCEDHAGERGYGPQQEEYGFGIGIAREAAEESDG
jgi:hypothetical protein